jgi:hypothetical protein
VRLRDDSGRPDELLARIVDHYSAAGHRLEPLDEAERHLVADGPAPRQAFGRPGCLDDGIRGRIRCLVVLDRSSGPDDAIDVSILSWNHRR